MSTPARLYFQHETAVVDEGAVIGARTRIWHFSHVTAGARIGVDCTLGQNVYVASTVVIGDRVKIQNNVSLYDGVTIESDVFIGPSAVFTNVRNPRAEITRARDTYQTTKVGRGATIGANATIVCGHDVGQYAFIGAGTVVTATIPDFALVMGVPARQFGWMCRCGERVSVENASGWCAACGRGYRMEDEGLVEVAWRRRLSRGYDEGAGCVASCNPLPREVKQGRRGPRTNARLLRCFQKSCGPRWAPALAGGGELNESSSTNRPRCHA